LEASTHPFKEMTVRAGEERLGLVSFYAAKKTHQCVWKKPLRDAASSTFAHGDTERVRYLAE
jgi:hypothetical protein